MDARSLRACPPLLPRTARRRPGPGGRVRSKSRRSRGDDAGTRGSCAAVRIGAAGARPASVPDTAPSALSCWRSAKCSRAPVTCLGRRTRFCEPLRWHETGTAWRPLPPPRSATAGGRSGRGRPATGSSSRCSRRPLKRSASPTRPCARGCSPGLRARTGTSLTARGASQWASWPWQRRGAPAMQMRFPTHSEVCARRSTRSGITVSGSLERPSYARSHG